MSARTLASISGHLSQRLTLLLSGLLQALHTIGLQLAARSADASVRLALNLADLFSFLG